MRRFFSSLGLRLSILFVGALSCCLILVDTASAWNPRWTQKAPLDNPPARHDAAIAYYPITESLVMFGGATATGVLNDTWTWNGVDWKKHTTATSPPAVSASMMTYDGTTGKILLFGGNAPPCPTICTDFGETWSWDGTTWTQLFPRRSPPARSGGRMVYDVATNTVILFGGSGQNGLYLNDTWSWNGTNWTQLFPSTAPEARFYSQMAYDSIRDQIVLFGGQTQGEEDAIGDTWIWDGSNWTERFPTTSPPPRIDAGIAFDPSVGGVVLYGGSECRDGTMSMTDTWVWTGSNWVQQFPAVSPSPRWRGAFAFYPVTGALLEFGGQSGPSIKNGGSLLNDTWMLK